MPITAIPSFNMDTSLAKKIQAIADIHGEPFEHVVERLLTVALMPREVPWQMHVDQARQRGSSIPEDYVPPPSDRRPNVTYLVELGGGEGAWYRLDFNRMMLCDPRPAAVHGKGTPRQASTSSSTSGCFYSGHADPNAAWVKGAK